MLSPALSFPEGSFANDLAVAIEQLVYGVKSQVGHAYVVGVGVDEGNGYSTPPIFNSSALFSESCCLAFLILSQLKMLLLLSLLII